MTDKTFEKYKLVVDEWFVNGFNGTKAYQKYYPKANNDTAKVKFSQWITLDNVAEYISKKASKTSDKLQITLEGQLSELNDIKTLAKKDKKYSDSINALREQNKLLALYEAHNRQKAEITILTEDERLKRIAELAKKG